MYVLLVGVLHDAAALRSVEYWRDSEGASWSRHASTQTGSIPHQHLGQEKKKLFTTRYVPAIKLS